MREIKFRAWDKLNNEWCAIDMAYSDATQGPISKPTVFNGRNQCVIMQYTGLKDKNGVEIYEGDIVERQGGKRGKVIFYAGGFFWEQKSTELTPLAEFGWQDVSVYEVLGNIYERPELCGW